MEVEDKQKIMPIYTLLGCSFLLSVKEGENSDPDLHSFCADARLDLPSLTDLWLMQFPGRCHQT
jgi:hypothetical protein